MADNLIPVNIVIGDRSYRIKTSVGDEEAIRAAVKTINDKILEFRTQFAGKDMQDYIAMVMIWYATQAGAAAPSADQPALDLLMKMHQQIDAVI
jgi:cell division protein ZapA